jgi:hypothetical protein
MINGIAFGFGLAGMIVLTKLTSYLAPFNLYFSISTLVVGSGAGFSPRALLIKLAIPFLVGFALCAVPIWIGRQKLLLKTDFGKSLCNFATSSAMETATAAAFFGSLLMSWPMIVHWDILAAFEIRDYFGLFIAAYFIYFISYGIMARSGARLALTLLIGDSQPNWFASARDSLVGTLMSGVAGALVAVFVGS